ncbi:MAG TPA: hypothetical protein VGG44_00890, partial [Tepidisphaeraceae bacterium]
MSIGLILGKELRLGRRGVVVLAIVGPLVSMIGCGKSSPAAGADSAAGSAASTGATTRTSAGALAAAGADVPAGYGVAAFTDSGKSLVTQKPQVDSVLAGLMSTFRDLETYFGSRPQIGSAYQDAHDSTTGGATFSATYHNRAVRGIVSCKVHDGSATIAVVFGYTDAPKSDWEKLMKPAQGDASPATQPAGVAATDAGADAAGPSIPLKEYDYADGTGSVGIADGWKTQC